MNFNVSKWDKFCKLFSGKNFITVSQLPAQRNNVDWIVVKHDVECHPSRALRLAKIEAGHGIKATYFVQANLLMPHLEIFKKIADLGHEVTYHYDVLDANKGNFEKALEEFKFMIEQFHQNGFSVQAKLRHATSCVWEIAGGVLNMSSAAAAEPSNAFSNAACAAGTSVV